MRTRFGMAAASIAFFAGATLAAAPAVQFDSVNNSDYLQLGNPNDAYWLTKGPWGAGTITEGPAPDQWEEHLGASPQVGPNGEVAWRMSWRWPAGPNEVKAYISILSGRKPGFFSSTNLVPNGDVDVPVRLTDGSVSQRAPTGDTPGTFMPMQLPLSPVTATFARSHVSEPTGQGQLTFDIWLQSAPGQDRGFSNASITHEIMIPLENYGSYGAFPDHRNPQWYDHDATIDGRLYHVYATKDADGGLRYDFGGLNGNYGKTGWKMIAFVPDAPIPDGQLNLASFINYIATQTDKFGEPWGLGNEYLASVELGVEAVEGTGDLVVYNYKVSATTPPPPPVGTSSRIQAEAGTMSGTGVAVQTDLAGYEGSGAVGPFSDAGDRLDVTFANVVAGNYDINFRYATGNGEQVNTVLIDGASRSEGFPASGSGWAVMTIPGVSLPAGTNVISMVKDWGFTYVDYVEIVPAAARPSASTPTHIQAEDGTLSGTGVSLNTDLPGYEGTAFAGPFSNDGDQLSMNFANVAAGTYDVNIRYAAGGQQNTLVVNGAAQSVFFPDTAGAWAIQTVSGVSLAAGTNALAIAKDWGFMDVDYIEIVRTGP